MSDPQVSTTDNPVPGFDPAVNIIPPGDHIPQGGQAVDPPQNIPPQMNVNPEKIRRERVELRVIALEKAAAIHGTGAACGNVLETAQKFSDFLNGEAA